MNKIEILAPSGGMESLYAAVRSGADAVYLGAKDFSARSSAQNFSLSELRDAVRYCHINGVKAYLTLNTLIFDSEMQSALNLATDAYNIGIDALIVQDIGLASLLRKHLPKLRLHGSTQMSIHTPSGAKLLWEMGFSRVVLSRELTLSEIQEIRESCPIELEVFVHGALCMCVSGQCYFSAMLGGRSGNRGMCAQPCRLPFSLESGSDYSLSLKDNSLLEHLEKLEEIGVTSAKIEGRMKRPEYVSTAVKAAREMRDFGEIAPETAEQLHSVFSRTGFTDRYFTGKRTGEMFGYRRKEDVTSANPKLLSQIRQGFRDEAQRIPLSFIFTAKIGEAPTLSASDGTNTAFAQGSSLTEAARAVALSEEKCKTLLAKCGGTPYYADEFQIYIDDNCSLPAKDINELRRQALATLSDLRAGNQEDIASAPLYPKVTPYRPDTQNKKLRARFANTSVPQEFSDAPLIFVPLFSPRKELEALAKKGISVGVEVPRGMFGREKKILNALRVAKSLGISHALVSNFGALELARTEGFTLHGGFGLNITNTAALNWAQEAGLADTELSFELTREQIAALGGTLPRGILSGGYLPLMLCRACPGLTKEGGCTNCNNRQILQDRLGKNFIFTCDKNCTEILNSVELDLSDKLDSFSGIDFHTLRFSVENSVEKVENKARFSSKHQKNDNFTRGLYFRGVK